jgi:DNA-binding NarL/FixJ family response regulator
MNARRSFWGNGRGNRRWLSYALGYGAALGLAAFLLDLADYRHRMMMMSSQFYVIAIAVGFAILGGWIGHRLTARPTSQFVQNQQAIDALGISARELEVLGLLAEGCANKLIARRLAISPNTVKTHVARLFEKLDVTSRTQAMARARSLQIIA